jgi:hypothetical protein
MRAIERKTATGPETAVPVRRIRRYIAGMDMSIRIVSDGGMSDLVKIAMIVAVLCPLIALPLVRRFGFALTLIPLLVNAAAACSGLQHVLAGLAIIGDRSITAVAAGIAEAQLPLIAGACSTILCAAIAAIAAWRRPAAAHARRFAFAILIAALLFVFVEPLFAFALGRYGYAHLVAFRYTAGTLGVCLLVGALATPIVSRGRTVRPLVVVAALSAAAGAEAWLVMRHFQHIALHGLG